MVGVAEIKFAKIINLLSMLNQLCDENQEKNVPCIKTMFCFSINVFCKIIVDIYMKIKTEKISFTDINKTTKTIKKNS